MSNKNKRLTLIALSILLLAIDQIIKISVKLNMTLGENFGIFGDSEWARILFVENNGMAFGMQLGGIVGKLLLSIFRIALVSFLVWYINRLIVRAKAQWSVLICLTLIIVGAIGNILDSAFYGLFFTVSTHQTVATLTPLGGGYAPFLCGRVVDMFYFPIIRTVLPSWIPFVGGNEFEFFSPVFNFADACISCGVIYLLLFKRKFFANYLKNS